MFNCEKCDQAFLSSSMLKRRRQEKPYFCSLSGKSLVGLDG